MQLDIIEQNGIKIAVVAGEEKVLTDLQSALDLMVTVGYEANTNKIVINKDNIIDSFFFLRTGLAGEILQ